MDAVQWLSSALALLPAGLIAGVGCGAGAGAMTWLKEGSQRRRERRDAGKAAALELVPLLTKFARECDSRWCCNEYEAPSYHDMPKLPTFPENLTWTALPQRTAAAIRALPDEIDNAESYIKSEEFPGQRYENASRLYILVGYRVAQLADHLRYHFGQGRYKSATEYDFRSNLRRQRRRLYRGPLRRPWDGLRNSRWVGRLKRALRRTGKRISSKTEPTGAA